MFESILTLVLQVVTLLVVVPAVTSGTVAVRQGGFLRGALIMLCIGLVNFALWPILALFTFGTIFIVQMLSFGLVGIFVNALAFRLFGGISTALYVKNYGSALAAAITMSVANVVIHLILS